MFLYYWRHRASSPMRAPSPVFPGWQPLCPAPRHQICRLPAWCKSEFSGCQPVCLRPVHVRCVHIDATYLFEEEAAVRTFAKSRGNALNSSRVTSPTIIFLLSELLSRTRRCSLRKLSTWTQVRQSRLQECWPLLGIAEQTPLTSTLATLSTSLQV